ncbi:hypothetical protein OSR52_04550, partial [Galbibacter sp. CMA-7]
MHFNYNVPLSVAHRARLPKKKGKKKPRCPSGHRGSKEGGDLLSHLRSTIGAGGLNCSVRNG